MTHRRRARSDLSQSRPFCVYQATLPDGSVYIGRTSCGLQGRIATHQRSVDHGSVYPLHVAMRQGLEIKWEELWSGPSWGQSMGKEIAYIAAAKRDGKVVLNRTRGGFYDRHDSELLKRQAMGRRTGG